MQYREKSFNKRELMTLTQYDIDRFQEQVWNFYHAHGRSFAWRHERNPYRIVVSELMLQQTQTHRVIAKYEQFIDAFCSFETLAQASLQEILGVWQGLGYNRRALYLHKIAQAVISEHGGILPHNLKALQALPGIGAATAASICAFAFNMPTVFIETNIRAVFIHTFFSQESSVHDKQIMPLIEQTLAHQRPRDWYYALMDYGVMLKRSTKNPSRKSAHHTRQSKFEGSDRQIRGEVIRLLIEHNTISHDQLYKLDNNQERIAHIVDQMCKDGLVVRNTAGLISCASQ